MSTFRPRTSPHPGCSSGRPQQAGIARCRRLPSCACGHKQDRALTSFERAAERHSTHRKRCRHAPGRAPATSECRDGPHQPSGPFLRFDNAPCARSAFTPSILPARLERERVAPPLRATFGWRRPPAAPGRGCIARLAGGSARARSIDVGASLDQQLHKIGINSMGRPVQRRGTVRIPNVHIGLALEIGANRRGITVLRGINQPHIIFDGRERGRREGDGQQQERRSGQNGNTKCQARQHRLPP